MQKREIKMLTLLGFGKEGDTYRKTYPNGYEITVTEKGEVSFIGELSCGEPLSFCDTYVQGIVVYLDRFFTEGNDYKGKIAVRPAFTLEDGSVAYVDITVGEYAVNIRDPEDPDGTRLGYDDTRENPVIIHLFRKTGLKYLTGFRVCFEKGDKSVGMGVTCVTLEGLVANYRTRRRSMADIMGMAAVVKRRREMIARLASVKEFSVRVGTHRLLFTVAPNAVTLTDSAKGDTPVLLYETEESIRDFKKMILELYLQNWESRYEGEGKEEWEISLAFYEGEEMSWSGKGDYPRSWEDITDLVAKYSPVNP